MENKEKIREFINQSGIPEEDKQVWLSSLDAFPEEYVASLAQVIGTYPEKFPWFNEILKKKRAAFEVLKNDKAKGEALLQEIYEEEKEVLEKL